MHEYLLFAQLPIERHDAALHVLAGFTRSQPVPICEQTLIYAQVKLPEAVVSKKPGRQQQQQNLSTQRPLYHKLTRNWSHDGTASQPSNPQEWIFRAEQTPDPAVEPTKPGSGKPMHISRAVIERVAKSEDLAKLQNPEWYRYRYQYTTFGRRFVYGNVIVKVCRFHQGSEADNDENPTTSTPCPQTEETYVDASGSFVVETMVKVEDAGNTKIVEAAKRELASFRIAMEGALDLHAPDRLALDTKVKGLQ